MSTQAGILLAPAAGPATARKSTTSDVNAGSTAFASGTPESFFDRIAPRMEEAIHRYKMQRASRSRSPSAELDAEIRDIDDRLRTLRELDAMLGITMMLARTPLRARIEAALSSNDSERDRLIVRQIQARRERAEILRSKP